MENIIFLDIETTGLPITSGDSYYIPSELKFYETSRIVEIAYIITTKDGIELFTNREIIKPNNFEIKNSHIHHITNEGAIISGKDIKVVLDKLLDDIFTYDVKMIVCHNINFDVNVLLSECHRNKLLILIEILGLLKKFCTCRYGASKFFKNKKYVKLIELYKKLFNNEFENQHSALSDVKACARCYFAIINS